MASTLKQLKDRALTHPEVRAAYDELEDEFVFLRQILSVRASTGLTQTQVAERIGTTQSAVARLESGFHRHSPSISTLRRYAHALGYRLDVRLVKETRRPHRDRGAQS